jgi:hypothetical protein
MVEIVGAIHNIKLLWLQAGELPGIENDIGPSIGIQIEQNMLKCCVSARQLDGARPAANVEQPSLSGRCFRHPRSVPMKSRLQSYLNSDRAIVGSASVDVAKRVAAKVFSFAHRMDVQGRHPC